MTTTEFSNEFDVLYNNIASNQAPGVDEYEKSVFLTKAQEEIVVALYSNKDTDLQSFEKTEELRRYLNPIVKTVTLTPNESWYYSDEGIWKDSNNQDVSSQVEDGILRDFDTKINYSVEVTQTGEEPVRTITSTPLKTLSEGYIFDVPVDLWFITYEDVTLSSPNSCLNKKVCEVIPITQDEFHKIRNNPFRGNTDNRVLRLDSDNRIELVSKNTIKDYTIRYLRSVKPINLTTGSGCELHPALHRLILDRAIKLAIASFTQNFNNT